MRTRLPDRRTEPSRIVRTLSCSPICRSGTFCPLYENDDVRPATLSSRTCARAVRISSVMPSAKYSFSGSALRLSNGSTAIDRPGALAACVVAMSGSRSAAANSAAVSNRSIGVLASER